MEKIEQKFEGFFNYLNSPDENKTAQTIILLTVLFGLITLSGLVN